jgi:hypothetical protein
MDSSEPHLPERVEPARQLRGPAGDSRRRFLAGAVGAGVGGIVLSIGSAVVPLGDLLSPAYAQATGSANPDEEMAAFVESIELALRDGYQMAVSSGKVKTPSYISTLTAIGSHHGDHAPAIGAAAGLPAGIPNPRFLDVISGQLHGATTEKGVLQFAYDLENATTATYLYALSLLKAANPVQVASSILPVESQHATVLGLLLNLDPQSTSDYLPSFVTQDAAFLPKLYPTPTA